MICVSGDKGNTQGIGDDEKGHVVGGMLVPHTGVKNLARKTRGSDYLELVKHSDQRFQCDETIRLVGFTAPELYPQNVYELDRKQVGDSELDRSGVQAIEQTNRFVRVILPKKQFQDYARVNDEVSIT